MKSGSRSREARKLGREEAGKPSEIRCTRTPEFLLLILLLRLGGVFTVSAFLAMLLPVEWMAAIHRAIGLGEFPRAPVVDYLARSVRRAVRLPRRPAADHLDGRGRYRLLVWYVAIMNVLFGLMLTVIDLQAGLPPLWTLLEGPPIRVFGILIAVLNRSRPR